MSIHARGNQFNKLAPGTVFHSRIIHSVSAVNVLSSHKRIENRRSKESWEADCDCAQKHPVQEHCLFSAAALTLSLAPARRVRLQSNASIGPASLGQIPGKTCLKPYRSHNVYLQKFRDFPQTAIKNAG
jgi:hypothetical protein